MMPLTFPLKESCGSLPNVTSEGFVCWYDNQMASLTKEAMAAGVQGSHCVIELFLARRILIFQMH